MIRSRLWGARVPLPRTGYAWLTTDSGQRLLVSPINGLVRCHGDRSATAVAVTVHAPRGVSHCTLKPPGIVRRPRRRNLADPARPVPDPVAVRTYHVHRPGGAGVPRRPSSMTAARPRPDEAAGWAGGPTPDPSGDTFRGIGSGGTDLGKQQSVSICCGWRRPLASESSCRIWTGTAAAADCDMPWYSAVGRRQQ